MLLGSHKYFLYKAPYITLALLTDITHYIPHIIQLKFPTYFLYKDQQNLYKARCYMAPLQSPLLHGTFKARYDAASLKLVATRHL